MPKARKIAIGANFRLITPMPRTGTAHFLVMQLAQPFRKPAPVTSAHACGEINAYIGIRDRLLEKAEASRTECDFDRVAGANEFVENCLRPARSPYEAQHLPESDAARERQRCEAVRLRLARLRTKLAHAA